MQVSAEETDNSARVLRPEGNRPSPGEQATHGREVHGAWRHWGCCLYSGLLGGDVAGRWKGNFADSLGCGVELGAVIGAPAISRPHIRRRHAADLGARRGS